MAVAVAEVVEIGTEIKVAYGRITPQSDTTLPALQRYLESGHRLIRSREARRERPIPVIFVLGDVTVDQHVLTGRLGYQTHVGEVLLDETGTPFLRPEDVPVALRAAAFAVDLDEGWVALEDVGAELPPDSFVTLLAEIANEYMAQDYLHVLGELAARKADTPYEFMASLNELTRAHFWIRSSNPEDKEEWRAIDQFLKRAGASRGEIVLENPAGLKRPRPGPGVDTENTIKALLIMIEDKHGVEARYRFEGAYEDTKAVLDGSTQLSTLSDEISVKDLEEAATVARDPVLYSFRTRLRRRVESGLLQRWVVRPGER